MPLTLGLLLLAGCTTFQDYVRNGFKVGPNYCPPSAPVADHWIDDRNPNVSSEPTEAADWWNAFNDSTLNELVQAAYRQNISVRIAGWRILEARAQRGIAAGNLFPQTQDAFGDFTRTQLSKNGINTPSLLHFDEWTLGTELAWELDFWGRFRRAVESADAKLDSAIENFDDVLVLLLADVAKSYVDVRTAEQRLVYARQNVVDQQKSLDLAKVKFEAGATTRLDVTQGQSNLSQTEATIPPLIAARQQAANQLCILMGMPPADIDAMLGKNTIPSASPRVVVGIPADLMRRRPDIRRAERETAAQIALIGVAQSDLYPHFSITGTIYYDAMQFKDLFAGDSLAGAVGPSFRWNILNYGRLVNNVRVQDARFQQLALQYQNTVLKANSEVENALIGFLQAQRQVRYLAESVEAARQSLDLVRAQYNEGKTDFNRVLNVEQLLTQQEDQWAVAQGSVAQNLVQIYKSLGGGWQIRLGGSNNAPTSPLPPTLPERGVEPLPAPVPEKTSTPVK